MQVFKQEGHLLVQVVIQLEECRHMIVADVVVCKDPFEEQCEQGLYEALILQAASCVVYLLKRNQTVNAYVQSFPLDAFSETLNRGHELRFEKITRKWTVFSENQSTAIDKFCGDCPVTLRGEPCLISLV